MNGHPLALASIKEIWHLHQSLGVTEIKVHDRMLSPYEHIQLWKQFYYISPLVVMLCTHISFCLVTSFTLMSNLCIFAGVSTTLCTNENNTNTVYVFLMNKIDSLKNVLFLIHGSNSEYGYYSDLIHIKLPLFE